MTSQNMICNFVICARGGQRDAENRRCMEPRYGVARFEL